MFSLKGQNKILWAAMLGSLVLTTAVLEIPFWPMPLALR